jgi:hypothetical protein
VLTLNVSQFLIAGSPKEKGMLSKSLQKAVGLLGGGLFLLFSSVGIPLSSLSSSHSLQATISVTAPDSGGALVSEGDDFFTRVVADRKDMNERLDLRWQVGISNISVGAGVWKGDWAADGMIYIHYPGLDLGAANAGPIGAQYPIDTSIYYQLSFRIKSDDNTEYWLWAYPGLQADGAQFLVKNSVTAGQWQTYSHDLSLIGAWNGLIQGLRIEMDQAADNVRFDWVRLTDPTTSPTFEITWIGPGSGTVDIYCDDDANYSNGTIAQIANDETDDGSFTWATAAFPPGEYYIYIEHSSDSPGGGDYSDGLLTIVPAPILQFTAPSIFSGDDYATTELNNPWDMDSWDDVLSSGTWEWTWHHLDPATVSFGGQLDATTSGNDPFIFLLVDFSGTPIDSNRYKYLSWRWYVEGDWVDSHDRLLGLNGWLTRFHYFVTYPYDDPLGMNTLNDVIVWEGWNTYTVDLSQPEHLDDVVPGPGPGWTGLKRGLRFDFLEGSSPSNIHVDWVMLTADPTATAGGTYDIEWTLQANSRPLTVTLRYDDDQDPAAFVGDIATLTPGNGDGTPPTGPYFIYLPLVMRNFPVSQVTESYTWDVPGHLSGAYYIYAELDDGLNVVRWYSGVPLVIGP